METSYLTDPERLIHKKDFARHTIGPHSTASNHSDLLMSAFQSRVDSKGRMGPVNLRDQPHLQLELPVGGALRDLVSQTDVVGLVGWAKSWPF